MRMRPRSPLFGNRSMQPRTGSRRAYSSAQSARRAAAPVAGMEEEGAIRRYAVAFVTVAGRSLMSQSILVTGGAGYVGSHACKALARAGYRPVVYDNLVARSRRCGALGSAGRRRPARPRSSRRGDALARGRAPSCISRLSPMSANRLPTRKSITATTSAALSRCLARCATRRSIGWSSRRPARCTACPTRCRFGRRPPRRRSTPTARPSWRSSGCFIGTAGAYGLKYMALRYFNAAGADPDGEIGEDHDPETHLIPLVLRAALGQRRAGRRSTAPTIRPRTAPRSATTSM